MKRTFDKSISRFSKLLSASAAVIIAATMLTACGDSDDDKDDRAEHPGKNKVTYNQKTVSLKAGAYYLEEDYSTDDAENMEVGVFNEDCLVYFDLMIPKGHTKLAAGTYTLKGGYAPFTILEADVTEFDPEREYRISELTLTVAVSGSTYALEIDGTLANGTCLIGNYTGTLEELEL